MDNKDYKLVIKKSRGKLNGMKLDELLSYKSALEVVCQYFDNLAQSNMGQYDDFKKKEYEDALIEVNKYRELSQVVFDVIKEKVDSIL